MGPKITLERDPHRGRRDQPLEHSTFVRKAYVDARRYPERDFFSGRGTVRGLRR